MNRHKIWIWLAVFLCFIGCNSETSVSQNTPSKVKVVATIEYKEGKQLFLKHCASCHNIDMLSDMTGPALYGVEKRWSNKVDLIHFIQNPQELINNNHERAAKVAALWPSEMTAFPQLDSLAIEEILAFVNEKGAQR